jgi:pyruvate kinase
MKKEIKIICTLGSTTLNKEFLRFTKNKISLLILNMSHLPPKQQLKNILKIRFCF